MPDSSVMDSTFADRITDLGIASFEEIEQAKEIQRESEELGLDVRLPDVLVQTGAITPNVKARVLKAIRSGGRGRKSPVKKLGQYRILRKLGEGGMGAVYLCEDTLMHRKVAVKVLPKKYTDDPQYLVRFRREAKAAGNLNHRNICAAFSVGEEGGNHYYVMEYLRGKSLGQKLERERRLTWEKAVDYVRQTAEGLGYAHKHGFVHRDIKPDNLVLTDEDVIKILDLGLAKDLDAGDSAHLTQSGLVLGTPHYISPEQARGESNVDGRADIYSLGTTFFHLLTGDTPFNGDNAPSIMMQHITEEMPDPRKVCGDIPEEVVQILQRMTAKEPNDRYSGCADLVRDLERACDGEPLSNRTATVGGGSAISRGKRTTRQNIVPVPRRMAGRRTTGPREPVELRTGNRSSSRLRMAPAKRPRSATGSPAISPMALVGGAVLLLLIGVFLISGSSQRPKQRRKTPSNARNAERRPVPPRRTYKREPKRIATRKPGEQQDVVRRPVSSAPQPEPVRQPPIRADEPVIPTPSQPEASAVEGYAATESETKAPAPPTPEAKGPQPEPDTKTPQATPDAKTPEPVPETKTAPAPVPREEDIWDVEGINVLSLADAGKDRAFGEWKQEGGELVSGDARFQKLELPYRPPEAYDVLVEFTKLGGSGSTSIYLPFDGTSFTWAMGVSKNTRIGFYYVGKQRGADNKTTIKRAEALKTGQRNVCEIQVRADCVTAFMNGKKVSEWQSEMGELSIRGQFVRDARKLGLFTRESSARFHRVAVIERSGPGNFTRLGTPAAKAEQAKQEKIWANVKDRLAKDIDLMKGISAYWPFEAGGRDQAGNRHLEAHGALPAPGKVGKAMRLDGEDDWLEGPDFDLADNFTISFWAKPTGGGRPCVLGKHSASGGSLVLIRFNKADHMVYMKGTIQNGTLNTFKDTPDGWHHMIIVGNALPDGGTSVSMFLDGKEAWKETQGGRLGRLKGRGWAIGQEWDRNSTSDHFPGMLDEIALWSRALNPDEVKMVHLLGMRGKGLTGRISFVRSIPDKPSASDATEPQE